MVNRARASPANATRSESALAGSLSGRQPVPMRQAIKGLGQQPVAVGRCPPNQHTHLLESKPHLARYLLLCSTAISEALNGIHH